jgi:hypothetical protein
VSKPSGPILAWLRTQLKAKGLNVAALANKTNSKRKDVRKVLEGREPLTVDQLMTWTQALELSLEELVAVPIPDPDAEAPAPRPADEDDSRFVVDPFGMQAEQALRFAFAAGTDFSFVCDTAQLADSGVPESVLSRFPQHLLIQLDSAYHAHNNPRYDERGVSLTLSFDTLYECSFPWSALVEVRLRLEAPDALPPEEKDEEPAGRPTLRLVT